MLALDSKLTQKYSKFQRRAVTPSPFTNVVIRAGPGTGKTTTLKWRIQNFVMRGVDPESILALSFTREAQDGLRRKVDVEMQWQDARRPTFKTFHALALMVIRAAAKHFPVCQFKRTHHSFDIIADSESKAFVAEAIEQYNEEDALRHNLTRLNLFARSTSNNTEYDVDANVTTAVVNPRKKSKKHKPRLFGPRLPQLPTDSEYVVSMKKWIRKQKNQGVRACDLMNDKALWKQNGNGNGTGNGTGNSNNVVDDEENNEDDDQNKPSKQPTNSSKARNNGDRRDKARNDRKRCALIYARYQSLLEDHAYLDIEDLCPGLLHILQTHRSVIIQLQQWARFILIDEFQDLNYTQVSILEHLCGGGKTSATKTMSSSSYLTVCGDPDQSIYGFRGALGIRGFDIIEKVFENQKNENQREMYKCELLENRRSLPPIVNASNQLIVENYKELTTAGRLGQKPLQMTPLNSSRRKIKGLVRMMTCKNLFSEVQQIVSTIETLRNDSSKKYKDFCILSRTNFGLKGYESLLSKKNIPWRIVGSKRTSETAARNVAGGGASKKRKKKGSSSKSSNLDQGVSLSTVHQAKGNEWPVVFVVNATEGNMPIDAMGEGLEEERRIFYVAMTRAKESCYLCWHRESNHCMNEPSRFLQESGVE